MKQRKRQQVSINGGIRARELRIIDDEKGNLGVMSRDAAVKLALDAGMDLIEISPDARPPVAKIMDYGKYMYDTKKKMKEIKARTKTTEVKLIQIKTGTGKGDLALKAGKISGWLEDGQRIRIELYLRGRAKYIDKAFLQEKMDFFLGLITVKYDLVEGFKKSPKGLAILIEPKKGAIIAKPKQKEAPAKRKNSPSEKVEKSPEEEKVSTEKKDPAKKSAPNEAKSTKTETPKAAPKKAVKPKASKTEAEVEEKPKKVKKVTKKKTEGVEEKVTKPKKAAVKKTTVKKVAKKVVKKKEDDKKEEPKK